MRRPFTAIILLGICALAAPQSENRANWLLQEQYSNDALRRYIYSDTVSAHWINEGDTFWYRWEDSNGARFMYVDCDSASKSRAFDHDKLAAALSELGDKPYVGSRLPFNSIEYNEHGTAITFTADEVEYEWNLGSETLEIVPEENEEADEEEEPEDEDRDDDERPTFTFAPDDQTFVYMQGYNLFVGKIDGEDWDEEAEITRVMREEQTEKAEEVEDAAQLTTDGEQFYEFRGVNYRTYELGEKQATKTRVGADWSEDSAAFAITRHDARKVDSLFVINSLSEPRPTLETYKYQMPGEENVEQTTLWVWTADSGKLVQVPAEKYQDQSIMDVHWTGKDHDVLRFVRRDRLQRRLELCEYDLSTNEVTVLISESVEDAFLERRGVEYVGEDNTGDMVWWSERTGWGHFYLYSHDGELKNQITTGAWRAEDVTGIDEEDNRLYFSAVGREPGQNVYNTHYYSIGLEGNELRRLTTVEANHNLSLSESRDFGVDTFSSVDLVPHSVVCDDRGRVILELETMDLSKLRETGWQMPETFTVKSADGTTDIYGNMWRPFDFDEHKKYPIILYVYPGPQTEAVSNGFNATHRNQELAQLGFIVLEIGNRGGTPHRDNAYHSFGYFNLRDYGLADKKAGVEELARRYPWMDITRVGIHGHSGGGFMTAAAMLLPPYNEFFDVGVSSAGNHDNNIYNANWSEQHHGLKIAEERDAREVRRQKVDDKEDQEKKEEDEREKYEIEVPTTVALAENLVGKLLIVHGGIDNNVHPANTIRLANALIKAGKRFDFMIMPGQRHGFGSMNDYFRQMTYEYFARHLLGDTYDESAEMDDKGRSD